MEIADPLGNDRRLLRADKNKHQRPGQQPHAGRNHHTENQRCDHRPPQPLTDALVLPGAVVLGDEDGESISEILHRHISKRVNFDCRSKCSHHRRPKTVHQPLYHQYPQIHHRLLHTGQGRKAGNLFNTGPTDMEMGTCNTQLRKPKPSIDCNTNAGYILGNHGSLCRAGHAPLQPHHKPQIQANIQNRRHRQES